MSLSIGEQHLSLIDFHRLGEAISDTKPIQGKKHHAKARAAFVEYRRSDVDGGIAPIVEPVFPQMGWRHVEFTSFAR